uniref:Gibberellin regulated protein n=1 Tax=Opuntia streptacantha TaxID=393608 RepID=A0A7C8ZLZ5_OPUST
MPLKPCFLFSVALFFLLNTKSFNEAKLSGTSPAKAPAPAPPTPPLAPAPPTPPPPPPSSKVCVGPCWERCHDIKAKNIRPCMVLCTRCCMRCNYVIPPACKTWTTVTIEGYTYQCP